MTASRISHRDLADTLVRLRAGVSASDLHGSLTGYLCAGGKTTAEAWPSALELDAGYSGELIDDAFPLLFRHCREQLDDSELGFEPLLPGDDVALSERAEALVEWCRGFLGGVGLASGKQSSNELSEDAREIVQDFSTIAASSFDYGDDDEDETALIEVLEFVRVGVLLLHGELAPAPVRAGNGAATSRRLH
ncbi:UPF0149 family protein [Dokdonella sp.]|uniref:UPF0149 family protein n=1 Tax=Dokdonella sp. TaxID=2291710 RepID=UPI003C51A04B